MAGKIKNKVFYAMTCLTGLGFGLLLGGMFIGVVNSASDIPGVSGNISLFDEDFSTLGISNTFALLSFIVTIVGIIMICADLGLRNKFKMLILPLHIASIAVTAVGAILILVSGIILAGDVEDAIINFAMAEAGTSDPAIEAILRASVSINAGAGIYLGFIGGLIAAAASGVTMHKRFMFNVAADNAGATEQPAATAQPATEQAATAQPATDAVQPEQKDDAL